MVTVERAGIDTWKPCWRIDTDGFAGLQMRALATQRSGRAQQLPEPILGHRVGWYPSVGVVYAEGHPAGADGLAAPRELPGAYARLEEAMLAADVPLPEGPAGGDYFGSDDARDGEVWPGFLGVSRLDTALDLRTSSTGEGAAIMAGVRAVLGQAGVQEVWSRNGKLETVYVRGWTGSRVLGRWYDKGVESGTADTGRLLRPEDQRRWPQAHRRMVEELDGEYVRELFQRRFVPLWKASKGVTVAGPMAIAEKVKQAVEAGEVTTGQAHLILGYVMGESVGMRTARATGYRRRAQARELGIVLADGVLEEVDVDLHDVLEQIMEADSWQ